MQGGSLAGNNSLVFVSSEIDATGAVTWFCFVFFLFNLVAISHLLGNAVLHWLSPWRFAGFYGLSLR